ncbi:hypothetical protein RQP46_001386 [Phenoliferia psychrophenolica]
MGVHRTPTGAGIPAGAASGGPPAHAIFPQAAAPRIASQDDIRQDALRRYRDTGTAAPAVPSTAVAATPAVTRSPLEQLIASAQAEVREMNLGQIASRSPSGPPPRGRSRSRRANRDHGSLFKRNVSFLPLPDTARVVPTTRENESMISLGYVRRFEFRSNATESQLQACAVLACPKLAEFCAAEGFSFGQRERERGLVFPAELVITESGAGRSPKFFRSQADISSSLAHAAPHDAQVATERFHRKTGRKGILTWAAKDEAYHRSVNKADVDQIFVGYRFPDGSFDIAGRLNPRAPPPAPAPAQARARNSQPFSKASCTFNI